METERRRRGNAVEAAARAELERAGLRLIAANVAFRGGELDLVMQQAQSLVFVEVRYRRRTAFGGGAASVDLRKRRRLLLAAQLFLAAHPQYANWPCRFDVVEADGDPPRLTWLRDAFRAEDC
ncbi:MULTISPECIES: YraN family protein [Xanthomonas]|uniref:YraN family protein n=1 Tax=Xanthomonas TaxID=338 RepID=UPI001ADD1720|nr:MULTISPECIES: YraN family protein [unclassified Xanthomonas]MBO9875495.1 YraN family protein [Xanthomonas sp. D-93]WNH44270.1 YraN family protein [Xanthomonas sp. A6251]